MDIIVEFGRRIRELRVDQGLSQEALAHKAGIDRTYLPGIEKGTRNASIKIAHKLAVALNTPLSDLLKFD